MNRFKKLEKKFGKAHADRMRKEILEIAKEPMPPSGGWCNSCERYDCGHYTCDGMVITQSQDAEGMSSYRYRQIKLQRMGAADGKNN